MYESKRITRVLIRNTFTFFVVFALIFTVLGVFVFHMVSSNIYKAADAQLVGQGMVNYVFVGEPTGMSAVESTTEPSESVEGQDDVGAPSETENTGEYFSIYPLIDGKEADGISEPSEKIQGYYDESTTSLSLSQQFIDESAEDNPQTVYLFRDSTGELLDTYGVSSLYPSYMATMPFDSALASSDAYSITHEDHNFRSRIVKLQASDGALYYLQAVINVDSEIEIMQRFTQTLVIGLLGALLACAAASYLLSRRTIRPIAEAWTRQTEFIQNASHELRTPLTVMQATQELLLEDPHGKIIDHFEDVVLMQEESERLCVLAEDLLLLSASDSHDLPLEVSQFSLDDMIKETVSAFSMTAEESKKDITVDLEYTKMLKGDEKKIKQVIIILLDNALKYTKAGDSISIASKEKNGMAFIAVTDTGIGMSDDDLNHAFDRFFRADKARTRTNDGMGLGLSLARSIMEAHGGNIEMKHNEPKGTVVMIQFPSSS